MQIYPLSESSLIVEFGTVISEEFDKLSLALAQHLENEPFPGFIEAVPAYTSTGVFFDPVTVRKSFPDSESAFSLVSSLIEQIAARMEVGDDRVQRTVEVPIRFGGADGPDLAELAEARGLSETEFAKIFLSVPYRVYMLGFLPGFAYMGEVDGRIAAPRLATPRSKVRKGSVGIAGRQTGIYPFESPGGWRLIGRTDLELFDVGRHEPSLFRAGDRVVFVDI